MANFNVVANNYNHWEYFGNFDNPDNFFVNYTGIGGRTATQFTLKGGTAAEHNIIAKGTGITYDADGNAIDGTITSLSIRDGNKVLANITGLSFNAGDFQSLVEACVADGGDFLFVQMFAGVALNISGGAGNDDLRSGQANDTINLGGGDDYIEIGGGDDTINGGNGFDFLNYHWNFGFRGINANLATGIVIDQFGDTDTVTNVEEIGGTIFNDRVTATDNDEYVRSLDEGRDRIDGGAGFDFLQYRWEQGELGVRVNLAAGFAIDSWGFRDTLISIEEIGGTEFNDTITGSADDNYFEPAEGDDSINGGAGFDIVAYFSDTNGIDANLVTGIILDPDGGTDTVTGIEGVFGTNADDTFTGNGEDNQFRGQGGADTYFGGGGRDEVRYDREQGGDGIVVNLATGDGTDTFGNNESFTGIERVRGSEYDDSITGNDENNRFRGLAGNDTMRGGDGSDQVDYGNDESRGGGGAVNVNLGTNTATDGFGDTDTLSSIEEAFGTRFNDTVVGSAAENWLGGWDGNDTMTGAGGPDNFVMEGTFLGAGNVDRITDFNVADTIWLAQALFADLAEGTLANNRFVKAANNPTAANGNAHILYNTTNGQLLYDADGNTAGGDAPVLIAVLTGSPNNVTAADFEIFT